jgi:hypothetical protein
MGAIQKIKENVYDLILNHLEIEGYLMESDPEFKEANIPDGRRPGLRPEHAYRPPTNPLGLSHLPGGNLSRLDGRFLPLVGGPMVAHHRGHHWHRTRHRQNPGIVDDCSWAIFVETQAEFHRRATSLLTEKTEVAWIHPQRPGTRAKHRSRNWK